jgi:hypothetical protein
MPNEVKTPEAWRNYTTKFPIPAFRLKRGDLPRLYQIINEKQFEIRDRMLGLVVQQPNEPQADFQARRKKVSDAFVTSVSVTAENGEVFTGNSEAFFESGTFPERLRSVFFSTITVPQAVLGVQPPCKIVVFLDFSRPPLLDFARLASLPTENESNFELQADNESWFTAATTRLNQFFADRRTRANWLHRAAVYDILLPIAGFPIALWACYRLSDLLETKLPAGVLRAASYIYVFWVTVFIFRVAFSYSRWVFPKVELASDLASSPLRHRGIWLVIILGLLTAFVYDAIKFVIS